VSVLYVPHGFGSRGGLEIDLRVLANGMVAHGERASVAGVEEPHGVFDGLATDVERVPLRAVNRPASVAGGVDAAVRARPGAVVHLFALLPSYLTFAALASARRHGNPVVWTTMMHPGRDRVWRRRPQLWPMLAFDRAAVRAMRFADAIAASTDREAELARRCGARRVELLPPVVFDGAEADDDAAAAVRERRGLGDAPLVVVVCSRDEPRKGLRFGFEAFAALRRRLPAARLLVVGLAGADGAPDGTVFAGRVPEAELAGSLRAADVVLVPALYEAFSRVTIEAWQQQTPVVVTDGVGLAQEVERHGAGAVVSYGDVNAAADAILRVLEDGALGEAGAVLVQERYTEDVLLEGARKLYSSLQNG
jgi:glycosyltransferase involved in cell wall biosynthesis